MGPLIYSHECGKRLAGEKVSSTIAGLTIAPPDDLNFFFKSKIKNKFCPLIYECGKRRAGGEEKKSVVVVEKVSRTLEQARAQSKVHETRS